VLAGPGGEEMAETKHTPGPWVYVGDEIVGVIADCDCPKPDHSGESEGVYVYPTSEHESHDIVPPVFESQLPEGMTMKRHQANCRLIAAAPDLLGACESILEWWETDTEPATITFKRFEQLKHAIDKATGGQQ
jgi:hypothetical protein